MKRSKNPVADCLHQTEQAHASAHAGGRRADADWPNWYADYLLNQTDLGRHTSRQWNQAELAEALADLDAAYGNGSQNQAWTIYAAARLSL